MRKFLIQIFVFSIVGYFAGEGIIRIFKLNVDVPNVYQDTNGLIRNKPNQTGYYVNGNKWKITQYGEFGYAPPSLDSLITIIGDSYVENIMNPPDCHQAAFLASMTKGYNFYPSAWVGAGFIQYLEMAKHLSPLKPIRHLLYINPNDFIESIKEIKNRPQNVQLSLEDDMVIFPKLNEDSIKKILYKFEFAYYIYRNYYLDTNNASSLSEKNENISILDYDQIESLLDYVDLNYDTSKLVLVVNPKMDIKQLDLIKKHGYKILLLKTDDYKSWQLPNDDHWSCYGHEEVAKQVAEYINKFNF